MQRCQRAGEPAVEAVGTARWSVACRQQGGQWTKKARLTIGRPAAEGHSAIASGHRHQRAPGLWLKMPPAEGMPMTASAGETVGPTGQLAVGQAVGWSMSGLAAGKAGSQRHNV